MALTVQKFLAVASLLMNLSLNKAELVAVVSKRKLLVAVAAAEVVAVTAVAVAVEAVAVTVVAAAEAAAAVEEAAAVAVSTGETTISIVMNKSLVESGIFAGLFFYPGLNYSLTSRLHQIFPA